MTLFRILQERPYFVALRLENCKGGLEPFEASLKITHS